MLVYLNEPNYYLIMNVVFADNVKVLSAKDLEWSKKNLPAVAEQKEATKLIETPKKKVARSKKVGIACVCICASSVYT